MSKNIGAIKDYLLKIGAPSDSDLLVEDEEEAGFLTSPWINYTLGDEEQPDGNFLLRFRYNPLNNLFQTQFWGRDFYEEWLNSNKLPYVSILVNKVNNRLNLGSFWLNLEDGTLALVSGLVVTDDGVDLRSIKANVDGLIDVLSTCYPPLKKFVLSEGTQEDYSLALNAIE